MGAATAAFTVGVEEEYQIVDAESYALRPRAERLLDRARNELGSQVQPELNLSQIEIGTPVCHTLDEVRSSVVTLRRSVDAAAARAGSRIAALATHPFADWIGQPVNPGERYQHLEDVYQQLAREQLICGCHVHVAVPDPDLAVRTMTAVRPWLPALLALTANSPFWEGVDTGYASYRSEVFGRWPTAGIPPALGSRREYDELVDRLVAAGVADASFLYWDVRPSTRYPTLELRVADVCVDVDDVVLVAALVRSLVRTCAGLVAGDEPVPGSTTPGEVLRVARWRSARFGLSDTLFEPGSGELRPAEEVVDGLLAFLRSDLEEAGEWDEVQALAGMVRARGNGAARQRAVYERTGSLRDVVAWAAEETSRWSSPAA